MKTSCDFNEVSHPSRGTLQLVDTGGGGENYGQERLRPFAAQLNRETQKDENNLNETIHEAKHPVLM